MSAAEFANAILAYSECSDGDIADALKALLDVPSAFNDEERSALLFESAVRLESRRAE